MSALTDTRPNSTFRRAGNMRWYHVKGCGTLFGNGDPAAPAPAYAISPPQVITSP